MFCSRKGGNKLNLDKIEKRESWEDIFIERYSTQLRGREEKFSRFILLEDSGSIDGTKDPFEDLKGASEVQIGNRAHER